MKQLIKLSFGSTLLLLLISVYGCESTYSGSIKATIGINCGGSINHEGDDVYAYIADEIFMTSSIQAGGHTNNEATDLGVNIFNGSSLVEEGEYTINSGGGDAGTAYIYYQPTNESNNEFISKDGQGMLTVLNASYTFDNPPQLSFLTVKFNDVMMTNYNTGRDTCISNFTLEVEL